jgi:uncharacterized protein (DUF2461 family)
MKEKQADRRKRVYDFYLENRFKGLKNTVNLFLKEPVFNTGRCLRSVTCVYMIIATDGAVRKGEIWLAVED